MEEKYRRADNANIFKDEHRGGNKVKREKKKTRFWSMTGLLVVLAAFVLHSCTMDGMGGGIGGTGITVMGIMEKGSIIVNGITFDASSADIREDDVSATEDELQDGMKVILKGKINDDGITGTALIVEARDEVQGRVTDLNASGTPPTFQVLKQVIVVSDLTLFSNFPVHPADVNDMENDQFVEVHGLRDADGNIRASRVELKADAGTLEDPEDMELKGVVSGLSGNTFFIGLQEIDFSTAAIEPSGATVSDGDLVEVEGSSFTGEIFNANKVEREDLEDEEFEPDEGEEIEIEGFVTEFTSHPGDFKVDGISVQTQQSTEFENGSELNLRNGIEIEVEGYVSEEGILLVEEVEFKQARIEINAVKTDVQSDSMITLLGIEIVITALTEIESTPQQGQVYKIEGFQDSNGDIVAESIEDGESDKNTLQGLVSSVNEVDETITLFESPWETLVELDAGMDFENDDDDTVIDSLEDFLALVVPGATIVSVEDSGDTGPDGIWDEAEIED